MIEAVSGPPHHDRGAIGDAIDLGDARWDAEDAGPPWRPPAWVSATGKVVALALVALSTVSAASTTTPQLGEPLWSARVAWDSFSLGRDLVYLRDGQHAMVARDARTGVEVWRREVSGNPMSVSEVGPELTTIFNSVRSATGETWSTVFLDPATGQVLGEREATTAALLIEGVTPAEDRVLLYGSQEAMSSECPQGYCGELALIDPPSLEPLWRFMTRRDERLVASFGANGRYRTTDGFALLTQDGRATIFEASTSAPELTVDVGPGATNGVLTDESLIVASRLGQQMVVTAYDRMSGKRQWETEAPLGPVTEGTGYFYVDECGAMICGTTLAGTALLESATGRLVTVIADHAVMSVGDGLILSTRGGFPSAPTDSIAIRSAVDGRLITELPHAFYIDWVDPGRPGYLLMQLGEERESRIILVEEHGRTRVLGTIPAQALTCMARGDLLACHHTGGAVSIWQLPFAA